MNFSSGMVMYENLAISNKFTKDLILVFHCDSIGNQPLVIYHIYCNDISLSEFETINFYFNNSNTIKFIYRDRDRNQFNYFIGSNNLYYDFLSYLNLNNIRHNNVNVNDLK